MASFVAVFDACVFYRAPVRDLVVRLAMSGLYRARWSDLIHEEWTNALLEKRSDLSREQLERTVALMNRAVPDATVTGFEGLITELHLQDPNDRHVLAAALRCQAGVIVTYNVKDFPPEALEPYGLEVQHPDEFFRHLFDLDQARVCAAVRDQRASLSNPSQSVVELLNTLRQAELATTVAALEPMAELL